MTGATTSAASGHGAARGRIDKRQAILAAAFTVFAREGYAHAGVSVIAAEAGVAKPTVYNHFGDKESLFRAAIAADADRAMAQNLAAVERLLDHGDDVRVLLEDVGEHLVRCYCDDRSWALRRLLYAELAQFPDLIDIVRGRATDRVTDALADRLARLSLAGRLRRCDPVEAAEQFSALLTGPLEGRARLGTRRLPDAELSAVARTAVRTFLHAYGPDVAEAE
ncbi:MULTISPECIES: TetR/AcrR family transcriptional regulator [Actinoalloteichus]|uniref:Transcriptional regulator, TetR family n=1 Tax=Actinoalloteichus fjordicus TaxID=1612552 RepID=A0AAC9PQW6_9PSEU|nr:MULTISPECIES: TetR/AcrR family transcriptional regulator [Actinoalloteichus]APU13357.1 transcriptional regulator, TetR family [Actinoalloteichus fjordicus]APU19307.1 transcriptional regulator, TetR family [Actinoalloteichus sp. GBA129-24]